MARIEKELLVALALSVLLTCSVRAQAISAASCNASDVQTALSSVTQSSATVNIPAGNCIWTSGITYTVPAGTTSLVIQGAGAQYSTTGGASTAGSDTTVITDAISANAPAISIRVASGQSLRVTGIAFIQTGASTTGGMLMTDGTSTSVRVDHCHFNVTVGGSAGLGFYGSVEGVADHNYFDSPDILSVDLEFHNGNGWKDGNPSDNADGSWADTEHWGTSQFIFVEDSRFYNGGVDDSHDGARYVFRHNTVTGDGGSPQQMYNHGLTDARGRATRAAEIYNNTFTQAGNQSNPPYSLNSGTLLYWGNIVTGGYQNAVTIAYDFRTTAGGGGNYQYVNPPNGWGFCGTAAGGPSAWDGNSNSSGYPCLDQPGRGAGDPLNGQPFPNALNSVVGTISWSHEALSPIYVWENTYSPQYYKTSPLVGISRDASSIVLDNRDYFQQFGTYGEPGSFNGTAGIGQGNVTPTNAGAYPGAPNCTAGPGGNTPGVGWWDTSNNTLYVCTAANTWTPYYTPYPYPHPLTQGAATGDTPTNLTAIAH